MTGATMNAKTAKNDMLAVLQDVRNGVQQYLANRTMVINGAAMKSAAVIAAVQKAIDGYTAIAAAHTAWIQAVATQKVVLVALKPLLIGLRAYVLATFGAESTEYKAFGFARPSRKQPTAETLALSVQKRLATRQARNTMGSRQRLKVVGTLPAASAPTSTPVAPAPAAPPAVVVSNGTTGNGPNGQSH
jgi:hypothetical protein